MQCHERKWQSTEKYLEEFMSKSEELRIPLSGSFELTHRCNLNCIHCYLGPQAERQALQNSEMSSARIHSLLDEITEAGCLYLLITGGEPLLRDDFPEIYRHAKMNGLLVTVFTNGTLVTDSVIELFRELPPFETEISIYGATAETYERITRVPGSYERCFRGIQRLLDNNIKLNLKTILMTINRHEFTAMGNIARDLGVRFRFDAAISPCIDGNNSTLNLRVPPEEAIEKEFSNSDKVKTWMKFFEKFKGCTLGNDLYGCGAGLTGFHVNPYGYLQPCMMTFDIRYNISKSGFLKGWNYVVPQTRDKKVGDDFTCRRCEKINLCGYCPDFFRMENGAEDIRSEYICKMGNLRFQYINNHLSKGDNGEQ
jgi:radical SAM protein with 4Fe4S-binding SPASM domain